MKAITQATEKRINDMVKRGHKFGAALKSALDEMKSSIGWYGASVKEMKQYGVTLDNETQINLYRSDAPLWNGLTVLFPGYINASFCLDLHYGSFYDFNALVRAVDSLECNGYGVY